MRLFTLETVDERLLRLLNQDQLIDLLLGVFDRKVFLFDRLQGFQELLLHDLVRSDLLLILRVQRFDSFLLIVYL